MSDSLLVICVVGSPDAEPIGVDAFEMGATAIQEQTRADGTVELRIGFESPEAARRALDSLPHGARIEVVDPAAWIESQRRWIEPSSTGPFQIVAPWLTDQVPSTAEHRIVIDPGAAFGHGGHQSTRLLLSMLPDTIGPGTAVVDVGTGTGVLSVAAAHLGATVLAIDSDPAAIDVARSNVALNGVTDRVAVARADIVSLRPDGDVALVNMTLDGHREAAPSLSSVPRVVVSGLLADQLAECVALYGPRQVRRRADEGEWAAAVLL